MVEHDRNRMLLKKKSSWFIMHQRKVKVTLSELTKLHWHQTPPMPRQQSPGREGMGKKTHILTCARLNCSLLDRCLCALLYKVNPLSLETKWTQLETSMKTQESKAWHGVTHGCNHRTWFRMGGRGIRNLSSASSPLLPNKLETSLG